MDDLITYASDESDLEGDFAGMLPVYRKIIAELQKPHVTVCTGTHSFGDGQDLSFMRLVRTQRARIPISGLLEPIDEAQKKGFQCFFQTRRFECR